MSRPEQITVLIEGARLVKGHPITQKQKMKDDEPVWRDAARTVPAMETFFAIAIPKQGPDWKVSAWGSQIVAKALIDYPAGESNAPAFHWKVDDGDSTIPNQAGNVISEYEGYPGNWVLRCVTSFAISAFHLGKYKSIEQIQNADEIKCGDYCNVVVMVGGNFAQSKGMYVNPHIFVLSRPGEQIVSSSGPSAEEFFGAAVPNTPTTPAAPVVPAPDFLNPPPAEEKFLCSGAVYTRAQLVGFGWSPEPIAMANKAP